MECLLDDLTDILKIKVVRKGQQRREGRGDSRLSFLFPVFVAPAPHMPGVVHK